MPDHAAPTVSRSHRKHPVRSLALGLLLVLGLAACGTDTSGAGAPDDTGQATGAATGAPSSPAATRKQTGAEPPVAEELKFTAQSVDGEAFDGATLAGKDAVLWFWAPWCTECRREAPHVAASQADNPGVVFVGVAGLGETADMRDFVDDYDVDAFSHLADLDGSLWQRFGVVQQPAYAFVDDTGTVEVVRGELGEDGLAEHVATLTSN
ncbi:Redoxin domain protein (plasmid) [Nocardioides sp. JS614]|nr:Redoxin domain protein [Nocardioides sp. JS614]